MASYTKARPLLIDYLYDKNNTKGVQWAICGLTCNFTEKLLLQKSSKSFRF